jgi:formylglycine-generating enzyme required for sulfatase activity
MDEKMLGEYAWFRENSEMKYHPVGQKKPNAWGLYDMLGNVAEWTLDQYDVQWYSKVKDNDPFLRAVTRYPRTVRGGSYRDPSTELRPSQRTPNDAAWNRRDPQVPKSKWWNADAPFVGFRLVRPQRQPTPEEAELFFAEFLK